MTQKEYWAGVKAMAEAARTEYGDDVDLSDAVHEVVDGSEWVIYTKFHFDVLRHTDSDDAIDDQLYLVKEKGNWHAMLQAATYLALYHDVMAAADEADDDEESDAEDAE